MLEIQLVAGPPGSDICGRSESYCQSSSAKSHEVRCEYYRTFGSQTGNSIRQGGSRWTDPHVAKHVFFLQPSLLEIQRSPIIMS